MPGQYNFKAIENKWQKKWQQDQAFTANDHTDKPKYYVLDMFPYPSGQGLHVGHIVGYTATDIVARYKRMCGFNVLHPMGWDAFGLPAEQYAIKTNTHPSVTTAKNVATYKSQMNNLGLSYDWSREINTTDPKYYRWTQWIFSQLYKKGLAYQSWQAVNWCPHLGTILANEEVIDGKSEVGGHPVERRPLRQWVLKITEYSERLLKDLDDLNWPESTKEMQRHWIGKSIGADIIFTVADQPSSSFTVFTTRPDTLFGATFCVLAPEHPLVDSITSAKKRSSIEAYIQACKNKSELERTANKDKTGIFIGAYALNPANNSKIPIFIADYVMMGYGTGAIMSVPGHDERDHAFAMQHDLPIIEVISSSSGVKEQAYTGDGTLVNSAFLDGLKKDAAIKTMTTWLTEQKKGSFKVCYKLRDWIFSRQRYWGEPFPLVFDKDNNPHLVHDNDLPVMLPVMDSYKPTSSGEPPLAQASKWLNVDRDGSCWRRETNIMPQWAGSCWYYLRYLDPNNEHAPWDPAKERYWMPVDLYVGGVEHANLHLLYARFWHKVLYDIGVVSTKEPFSKLIHQGLMLGTNGEKMSKSRGNVINPDEVVAQWGADSLRMFEMFMSPLEQVKPWSTTGIAGIHRFLKRIWRLIVTEDSSISNNIVTKDATKDLLKWRHKTITKLTHDTENLHFNTAISCLMEWVNMLYKQPYVHKACLSTLLRLLAPYAPHLAQELWERLAQPTGLTEAGWPQADSKWLKDDRVTVSVMINGRLRTTIELSPDSNKEEALAAARSLDKIARNLNQKVVVKTIYVPSKVINFVCST